MQNIEAKLFYFLHKRQTEFAIQYISIASQPDRTKVISTRKFGHLKNVWYEAIDSWQQQVSNIIMYLPTDI